MNRSYWTQAMDSLPPDERLRYAGRFVAAERYEDSVDLLLHAGAKTLHAFGAAFRWFAAGLRATARALDSAARHFGA